jgi:hypothetical protein
MQQAIEELKELHRRTVGEELNEVTDVERVLELMRLGRDELIVMVAWEPDEPRSIVLREVKDERVYYYNPRYREGAPDGTVLSTTGPARRVEGGGLESFPVETLKKLFQTGEAVALVPTAANGRSRESQP